MTDALHPEVEAELASALGVLNDPHVRQMVELVGRSLARLAADKAREEQREKDAAIAVKKQQHCTDNCDNVAQAIRRGTP